MDGPACQRSCSRPVVYQLMQSARDGFGDSPGGTRGQERERAKESGREKVLFFYVLFESDREEYREVNMLGRRVCKYRKQLRTAEIICHSQLLRIQRKLNSVRMVDWKERH